MKLTRYFLLASIDGYWYNHTLKRWEQTGDCKWGEFYYSSNFVGIHSYRAFCQRLKEWRHLPAGTVVELVSKYDGCDRLGIIKRGKQ